MEKIIMCHTDPETLLWTDSLKHTNTRAAILCGGLLKRSTQKVSVALGVGLAAPKAQISFRCLEHKNTDCSNESNCG